MHFICPKTQFVEKWNCEIQVKAEDISSEDNRTDEGSVSVGIAIDERAPIVAESIRPEANDQLSARNVFICRNFFLGARCWFFCQRSYAVGNNGQKKDDHLFVKYIILNSNSQLLIRSSYNQLGHGVEFEDCWTAETGNEIRIGSQFLYQQLPRNSRTESSGAPSGNHLVNKF